YKTCASAVAPVPGRQPAVVDVAGGRPAVGTPDRAHVGRDLARVEFVPPPAYSHPPTPPRRPVRCWGSARGSDEMNVWPWHDCAVGRVCSFCGINTVLKNAGRDTDMLHALEMRKHPDLAGFWASVKGAILGELAEAVGLAINDECYREEAHL